jgi:hypothetical protein
VLSMKFIMLEWVATQRILVDMTCTLLPCEA